jgi:ribosomal protein S26
MSKPKSIGVKAMADMTRREVHFTNSVANTLIDKHHMCIDCAIKFGVAFIKSQRSKHSHIRTSGPCSDSCAEALH